MVWDRFWAPCKSAKCNLGAAGGMASRSDMVHLALSSHPIAIRSVVTREPASPPVGSALGLSRSLAQRQCSGERVRAGEARTASGHQRSIGEYDGLIFEEATMTTYLTRPTLAELWRVLLTLLESLGAEDAPGLARSLAVAGLIGRPAQALGVRVKRLGRGFLITSRGPVQSPSPRPCGKSSRSHARAARRARVLAAR
jgi:hypothetical protein